jgi:uncharacterized protein (TIGR00159 family)
VSVVTESGKGTDFVSELLRIIRPQDVIDILIMTFLIYQLYSWFKNTKAMQVVMGLGVLGLVYLVTKQFGLFMTSWILQELGTVLLVLVIVIFQAEIRQALYRFSLLRSFFGSRTGGRSLGLEELSTTIFSLAKERIGALVVFQREEPLEEHLLHGVAIDSVVSGQLVQAIFRQESPLHDGAAVISDGRLTQASCHLPLSANVDLPQHYGTRHRAGIGITERSDALVVIISEERGEVSLAEDGKLQIVATSEQLCDKLNRLLLSPDTEVARPSFFQKIKRNHVPKLVIFTLVLVGWFAMSGRQAGIVTVTAPVKFRNLPERLALAKGTPEEVEVQLKVFSGFVASPQQLNLVADLNLADVREGTNTLAIRPADVQVPLGVVINTITPSSVKVVVGRKITKVVRVEPHTVGRLGQRLRLKVEPAVVSVEGPEHLLTPLESVRTEQVDLSAIRRPVTMEKNLLTPAPEVRILLEKPVTVQIVRSGR